STTVASRRFVTPFRDEVTCTGTRTAPAWGKKRANRSAQLFSFETSSELPFLPTSPHDLRFCRPSAGVETLPSLDQAQTDGARNVHAASRSEERRVGNDGEARVEKDQARRTRRATG